MDFAFYSFWVSKHHLCAGIDVIDWPLVLVVEKVTYSHTNFSSSHQIFQFPTPNSFVYAGFAVTTMTQLVTRHFILRGYLLTIHHTALVRQRSVNLVFVFLILSAPHLTLRVYLQLPNLHIKPPTHYSQSLPTIPIRLPHLAHHL